ncbi:MAG: chromosomal replication initiator protein DnaA [Polyangiaceae bacterium]|nr:chromosomal replication initiator protein DnaA [Polyangiaceae bacterium]MCB9608141.1 chromosomal replication initiator protein DnaA [Polyangiaceae bacterium]
MTSSNLEIWTAALERTRKASPASFEQWFSSIQFDKLEAGRLELTARDEFVRDWVKTHFLPSLVNTIDELRAREARTYSDSSPQAPVSRSNEPTQVEWRISSELNNPVCDGKTMRPAVRPRRLQVSEPPPPSSRSDGTAHSQSSREPRFESPSRIHPVRASLKDVLNPKYTFENFVVGPSNELAYAAAMSSAGDDGPRYNPLFICGGTGLGKTHLVHAIAQRLLDQKPNARVIYVSAERFTNEFIEALQHQKMDEFRNRYRRECDLLLLDDIQFLAGREQTQEEFFHTFNALHEADRPIVVTSDTYPQQLQRMPERLVSRFTSGLVADVQVPRLETRVAIVRKKAQLEGIPLTDEVAVLLAQNVQSNVRELEGALIRLAAKSSLTGRPIDYEFASRELAAVAPRRQEPVSVQDIQRAVCNHFRLTNAELLSKDRHKSVAFARQVAMYLCRQRLRCSYPELGRSFGNRDHTTVMSAVRRVEALRQKDPQVNAHLEAIEQELASSGE